MYLIDNPLNTWGSNLINVSDLNKINSKHSVSDAIIYALPGLIYLIHTIS